MARHHTVSQATLLIIVSSCSFGSLSTATLLLGRQGMPLLPAMLWRYLIASITLFILARMWLNRSATRRQALRLMIIGGCGQAAITYLSLRALDYLPVGPLALLFYTYPAWVAAIMAATRRERLTLRRTLALTLAIGGIAVITGTPSTESLNTTGVLLALGTAFLFALYMPALHNVQQGLPPIVSTFYLILGVLGAFLAANLFTGSLQLPPNYESWMLIALISLVSTVLAFITLIAGLGVLGPVRTSIISAIEPFFTVLLGVFVLGETLSVAILAGGGMIAGAVVLLQWKDTARIGSGQDPNGRAHVPEASRSR